MTRLALVVLFLSPLGLVSVTGSAQSQEFSRAAVVSERMTPWSGDLDGMIERRMIRVLVPYSRTLYFLDGPEQRGIS